MQALKSPQIFPCYQLPGRHRRAASRAPLPVVAMSRNLALVMLGDVMLGRIVDESLTHLPSQLRGVWGDTLPLLQGGMAGPGEQQLVAGNLECAVTAEEQKEEKAFNFKLSPRNVETLKEARFDFVSLANNHTLDYREAGLLETQRVLGAAGIAYAGVGLAGEAVMPVVVEQGGLMVAFLSYSDHYDTWAATEQRKGINFINPEWYSRQEVQRQLAQAQQAGADLVVVFVHWGPNWKWQPSRSIQQLAHDFIDAGADVVFGHSSHHIQGIEVYRQNPIVYGAGGWVDDYRLDESYRNDLGFLYCCHINDGVPASLELVPTKISHTFQGSPGSRPPYISQVHLASGRDASWLCNRVQQLSKAWGTRFEEGRDRRLTIQLQEAEGGSACSEDGAVERGRQGGPAPSRAAAAAGAEAVGSGSRGASSSSSGGGSVDGGGGSNAPPQSLLQQLLGILTLGS